MTKNPRRSTPFARKLLIERLEDRRLMAVIELATLTNQQGSNIFGSSPGDYSGSSVSNAGDVNGDGFDDLIVGAYRADIGFGPGAVLNAGKSYLIFGGAPFPSNFNLFSLGTAGVAISGAATYDYAGFSVGAAGDVNGDGYDDLILGAKTADPPGVNKIDAGISYIVFGKPTLPSSIDLAMLGSDGVTIYGIDANDNSGNSVSSAGDVNGDGFDDVIIGAVSANSYNNARDTAGESYIIFGKATFATTIDLASLGTAGVKILGADGATPTASGDYSGVSVSGAGDVNGDGLDDLIIGSHKASSSGNSRALAGESFLLFGSPTLPTTIDLSFPGSAGVTIFGADGATLTSAGDYSGVSVSGAGDVNGDGFDDVIVGAFKANAFNEAKVFAGESYLLFGSASLPATIDLSNLGSAGITIFGSEGADYSGFSVSNAGDVNGDGFDDLIIGSPHADPLDGSAASVVGAGKSYVIFGSATMTSNIDLSTLGTGGVTINGANGATAFITGDYSGTSVSNAGDVNGDGFADLIIGAKNGSVGLSGQTRAFKTYCGDSYVLFGNNSFTSSLTNFGNPSDNTLTGTAAINIMNGARGNDTLIGGGGADVLTGGQGNDTLAVSDLTFKRIIGGTGSDTLRFDGSNMSLNLASLADNRILGIEAMDITGSGNNTLSLNYREVLNISDKSNTLIVKRNSGDLVNIGTGWTQGSNEIISSNTFAVYTQGQAILKVQTVASTVSVVSRQIFYNHSPNSAFGDGTANPTAAIDTSKLPLLPGQTTSFVNYSNYFRGLNGLLVDIASLPGTPTAADFQFSTWDGNSASVFSTAASLPTIAVFPGSGVSGSGRIKIEFADYANSNTWLRVTVLANANTGLTSNDVFYFGNAVGDFNVGNIGSPTTIRSDATDLMAARQNQTPTGQSVGITNIYDINKDGRVNPTDLSIIRQYASSRSIRFFTAPVSLRFALTPTSSAVTSMNMLPLIQPLPSAVPYATHSISETASNSTLTPKVALPQISNPIVTRSSITTQWSSNEAIRRDSVAKKSLPIGFTTQWISHVDEYFASVGIDRI